jgi:hypothetical protein
MTLLLALLLTLTQDADRIQELIRKLGSEDFAAREQATEDLKRIGKPAHEALKKAADESSDPEVRQRAQALLDEPAKPEKPAPRKLVPLPPPAPGRPGVRASSVSVRTVNGDSTYTIRPADDLPTLTFHKAAVGLVKLEYTDEKGESKSADAPTLEGFLKDHADLAQKFGITAEGIDYAGSRVSFKGQGRPDFAFPRFNVPPPPRRLPPQAPPAEEDEPGVLVGGARLAPVDDAMRAQLDLPEGQGVVVTRVAPDSAADALGLRKSDILLEIDDKKITSPDAAKGLITRDSKVALLRKGKRETLSGRRDF